MPEIERVVALGDKHGLDFTNGDNVDDMGWFEIDNENEGGGIVLVKWMLDFLVGCGVELRGFNY